MEYLKERPDAPGKPAALTHVALCLCDSLVQLSTHDRLVGSGGDFVVDTAELDDVAQVDLAGERCCWFRLSTPRVRKTV
jgi:hypothetical protein